MKKIAFIFLVAAICVSGAIIVSRIGPSSIRNILLLINLFFWFSFVVLYPFSVIKSGVVSGTQPTSLSYRHRDSIGFWTGLVATEIFWVVIFGLVLVLTYTSWFTAP